ncbi:MAG: DUF4872 domain-containing protein [Promethearchaeota archaeon]
MIIEELEKFRFQEKNSGAFKKILEYEGITIPDTDLPFSESLLMGIGGGIGAEYLTYSTRPKGEIGFYFRLCYKPQQVTSAKDWYIPRIASRLGIKLTIHETTSQERFVKTLVNSLNGNRPVIVFPSLGKLKKRLIFPYSALSLSSGLAPHYGAIIYGIDEDTGRTHILDRRTYSFTLSLEELAEVRSKWKHKAFIVQSSPKMKNVEHAIRAGITDCYNELLKGFNRNIRVDAFQVWAERLVDLKHKQGWITFTNNQLYDHFVKIHGIILYFLSSQGGLRSIYANFLEEASDIINNFKLKEVSSLYRNLSDKWGELAKKILPESIPLFKDTCESLKKYNTLFLNHNQSQMNALEETHDAIKTIRVRAIDSWPFNRDETINFLKEISQHLLSIHKEEKKSIMALKSVVS